MKSSLFRAGLKGKPVPCPLSKILQGAVHRLESAGIENSRLEAEILLAHLLQISRIELYTRWDEECQDFPAQEFQTLVFRRSRHEPLAYLIGQREFWSLDFTVSPSVLIPRPETEFVVEAAVRSVFSSPARIVDVGTGSGNIAVCLARQIPQSRIFALDISQAALMVARRNAALHQVSGQIMFLQADLLSPFAPNLPSRTIDCVVSNPPYIPSADIPALAPDVRSFEPQLALDGGADGLSYYRRLIQESRGILKAGGWLILEMGYGQKDALVREVHSRGYEVQEIIADYAGIDRVIVARLR
jgi:release factor glutamine methyltransferase